MLAQLRNMTRGWVAYVLLFLLTIAFAIWGINDVFNGVGSRDIATVGGGSVTPAQLSRELELTLRGQQQQGVNVTQQEAIDSGFHLRLLEGLIGRRATYAYATKVGVDASNRMVADRIREIPAVNNPVTGTFDQTAYAQFLQQLRYSQGEFEEDIRGDLTRNMLLSSLSVGGRTPTSYAALQYTYLAESRVVSIAQAPASAIGAIAAPTEEQLTQFYQEQRDNLRLPEFRALTLVYARPADFISRVTIPEDRLQEEIEARRLAGAAPERRTFARVTAQNEAQANDIAARLSRGEDAAAVGSALGVPATRGENQARAEVSDTAVAAAVFSMQRGQTRVVRGALTPFVVVRLDAVTAAVSPDLAVIREQARQAIAADEASRLLDAAVATFDDARAAGTAIDAAARQAGFPVLVIPAVEERGRNASGQPITELEGHEDALRAAFQTPEGEATDFMPVGNGDVIVAVTSVTPERVQPMEDVREDLVRVWTARERATRLRELADRVVAAVSGGQEFNAAARANRFSVVVDSRAIDRAAAMQAIPSRGLAGQIFNAREGQAVADVAGNGEAVLVAVVETINRPVAAEHPQEIEAVRLQLDQPLASAYETALIDEIVARANVRRNEALLNSAFRATDAEGEDGAQ
jgi:peptidyl-prolyl cis-trans isomerase D